MNISSTGKKYLSASVYYIVGNAIGQGVVLLSSAIFTRIMSKEAYGMVSTYSTWVLILNTFICLNLFISTRNGYVDYFEDYEKFKSSILTLSLISALIISVLILIGSFLFHFEKNFFSILVACIQAISLHTINFKMASDAMENKYKERTVFLIVPNVLHTVLSIGIVMSFRHETYYGKIIGNMAGMLVMAVIAIIMQFKKNKPCIITDYWKYALSISLPGIIQTLSDLILLQCDRIMLTALVGAESTAEYSLVYNIGSIIYILYTAVSGAWVAWLYKNLKENNKDTIFTYQKLYVIAFLCLTILILCFSPEVITILSPSNYWAGINYLGIIVFSSYVMYLYSFFVNILIYNKQMGIIAVCTTFVSIINIVLNYVLIPLEKSRGAAFTTLISYLILLILYFFSTRKHTKKIYSIATMVVCLLVLAVYVILFTLFWKNILIRLSGSAVMLLALGTYLYKKIKSLD